MENTFFSVDEMVLKGFSVAYSIEAFAKMQNPPGEKWNFQVVMIDKENSNLYHAVFALPNDPESRLTFDYELLPSQEPGYRCSKLSKIYRNQSSNRTGSSQS